MRDLGADDEVRVADEMIEDLGDEPARLAVLVEALDEDPEEREPAVARREDVVRVQVPELDDGPQQAHMELVVRQLAHMQP